MLQFHFCTLFKKEMDSIQPNHKNIIDRKILEYKNRNNLKNISNIEDIGGGVYLLRIREPESRVIIQEQTITVDNERINVFFVRDLINNIKFDREAGRLWYGKIKRGDWLKENELSEDDIENFKSEYKHNKNDTDRLLVQPPNELINWLHEFSFNLGNEIYETKDWVAYALSNNIDNGMLDSDVKVFRLLIDKIVNSETTQDWKLLKEENGLKIYSYESTFIGVIFSKLTIKEDNVKKNYFLFYNGAHIRNQSEHWNNYINLIKRKELEELDSFQTLSRVSFRSYPKWTLTDDDLWFTIQKSDENSNLSLTHEQISFLQTFKFPYYINGQAGSGKSTLLYYVFANLIYFKESSVLDGEIIFLTENEQLLEDTKNNVFDLLEKNGEFEVSSENLNQYENDFNSFKNFLLSMLTTDDLEYFNDSKYLSFPIFKTYYEKTPKIKTFIKNIFSAEEAWFVISTYIYGYDVNQKITSTDYDIKIPNKSQKITLERFKKIEKEILPYYEELLDDGYWDKLKVIRYINENINLDLKNKYDVIVCDEAQDFCRVELSFILKQSKFLQYDLSMVEQVPILFAGDSNQTVNPTGFRDAEMTSLLYQELKEISNYNYAKKDIFYSPNFNYRSVDHVVNLANFIQFYRKKLGVSQKYAQEPKLPDKNVDYNFNIFLNYEDVNNDTRLKENIEELVKKPEVSESIDNIVKKLEYKIFIVPESHMSENVLYNSKLLDTFQNIEIKTSIEAKGAQYKHVVLYGFGDYFLRSFKSLNNLNHKDEEFQKAFYFNKLYVAITRAKSELIIIDSKESYESFWKKLVTDVDILEEAFWEKLVDKLVDSNSENEVKRNELKKFKDKIIMYNTGSINNTILKSNKKDALDNAEEDKKLGEHYQNPGRLQVAASQFFRLGKKDEANFCKGLAEEILYNFKNAAKYYEKANRLEFASSAYFKGGDFNELEEIGNYIQDIEHDLRIIIARIMQNEHLTFKQIEILSKNKRYLSSLIKKLPWRDELIDVLIRFSQGQDRDKIRELVKVMETIVWLSDKKFYETIANIHFELEEYKQAINAWEKIDSYSSENYYLAKVEFFKEKDDTENTVIYLNELIRFKEDKEKRELYKEIIKLYNKEENTDDFSNEYNLIVYRSFLILEDMQDIVKFGKLIEEKVNHFEVEYFYKTMVLDYVISKEAFNYIVRRWVKVITKNIHDFDKNYLEEVNKVYFSKSKIYLIPYKPFTLKEVEEISDFPQEITFLPSNHLSHITIENFRQFKYLNLDNIGQFNLIVGDNNVGKTSLLEALLFMNDTEAYFNNLAFAYIARNNTTLIQQDMDELKYKLPKEFIRDFFRYGNTENEIKFQLQEDRNQWIYKIQVPTIEDIKYYLEKDSLIDIDDFICMTSDKKKCNIHEIALIIKKLNPDDIIKMQLIPFGKGFDRTLAKSYLDNIDRDKKKRKTFLESMKIFIPNIERITADTESGEIDIEEDGVDDAVLLHQYGEGANKLFRILVQILLQKDKKLLIDEIDAGVHYSHFKEFWKIILKSAKENGVQIFATTHNIECIRYFKEALEEIEDNKEYQALSRTITLEKLIDSSKKTYTRTFEEFEYELDGKLEIRGGNL